MACGTAIEHNDVARKEDWALPGLVLNHDMMFVLSDWKAWGEVIRLLQDIGAKIVSFSVVAREEEGWLLRCRVKAIKAPEARALVHEIRTRKLACVATIEHLLLKEGVQ